MLRAASLISHQGSLGLSGQHVVAGFSPRSRRIKKRTRCWNGTRA